MSSSRSNRSNRSRSVQRAVVLPLLPLLLAGCPTRPINKVEPERIGETHNAFIQNLNRDVDILFVIDNSGSMGEEQTALATKLPDFINVLAALPGGLPNVHIGVVSSNMGAGTFSLQSCETAGGDRGRSCRTRPVCWAACRPAGASSRMSSRRPADSATTLATWPTCSRASAASAP